MVPYLEQVARHWADAANIGRLLFIFPNRRSLAFFRKYLKDSVVGSGRPFLAPKMLTINDFFCKVTGRSSSDRITLLVSLYDCYCKLNSKAESLDDFISWGDVLLADFDDVDKYLVDARDLFANIADLKAIENDFSYIEDKTQREAIERLCGQLSGKPSKTAKRDVKASFVRMWNLLYPLYTSFNAYLEANDEAYEGQIYRSLAQRIKTESISDILSVAMPDIEGYVFVGLNALNECERKVLKAMHTAGLAEFTWDYSGPMVTAKGNGSTHFMERNLADFPGSFVPKPPVTTKPKVHVCGIPSAIGQARLLPELLSRVPENERGIDFAAVLGDETMLMSVLNSLPVCPDGVNVTMGYPLSSSEWAALMSDVMELQMHLRQKNGRWYFYHRQVSDIFSSGILKRALSPEETAAAEAVLKAAKYYIPQEDLATGPVLQAIFRPSGDSLANYLLNATEALVAKLDDLQAEFAQKWYCCVNRLKDMNLPVQPRTWIHLLQQLVAGISVPFEGEPLGGLQVMGPLETRALDFKHLVIMGANESVFPRSSISPSFVPPEIRKAFGLPTYEYQEDVWAYYFYRMISRAENVWMLYDTRTDGLNTGEESRYIKQLQYLYPDCCEFERAVAQADIRRGAEELEIPKTAEAIEKMAGATYSASLIQKYIACKASFYYYLIADLKPLDEVSESLDAGMLGEVCHGTMQAIYSGEEAMRGAFPLDSDKRDKKREFDPLPVITRGYIEGWLKREDEIRAKVIRLIATELKSIEVTGRDLVTADIIVRMVLRILREDLRQMGAHGSFRILGLEENRDAQICGHRFKGVIDRIDSFEDGVVRVVDYKTGGDKPEVLDPDLKVDKVFSELQGHEYKAALQFYVYDRMMEGFEEARGSEVRNAMYAMSDIFTNEVKTYPQSSSTAQSMEEKLEKLFEELSNPEVGFARTNNQNACKFCDYRVLCGRTAKQ